MAKKDPTVELLKSVDIFSGLNNTEILSIAKLADTLKHTAGKVVVRKGDPSDDLQIIESGLYEVYLWDELFKIERPLGVMKSGEIFGEMGVITGEPRSAFIRCRKAGSSVRLKKDDFIKYLENNPKVAIGIARTLVHRLNASNSSRRIPFENISRFEITRDIIGLLPLQVILRHRILPLRKEDLVVTVGMVDPSDLVGRNVASEFLNKFETEWVGISQPEFESFRNNRLHDLLEQTIADGDDEPPTLLWLAGNTAAASDLSNPVSAALNGILEQAIEASASDLHLEPGPRHVAVRARIDGRLLEHAAPVDFNDYRHMVSRIKVLCDLDITETRLPQEASIRTKYGDRHVDLRVSTLPTPRGESVVIRLLDPQRRQLDLRNLVVNESAVEMIERLFFNPSGLLLVTGPTGSGKTTTLYSGIRMRLQQNPTDKLITAEDPVEYEFENATQVQVKESVGLTFGAILRSMLRQDPDVVLVGEMRDRTSMDIAFEAALTGHFVMSSLHTNNCFETVQRLRQRGVEPYVIASALRGIICQRLVSKICVSCRTERDPTKDELERLRFAGVLGAREKMKVWSAPGCADCRMTGARGRIGLYEVLVMSPEVRHAIELDSPVSQLAKAAPPHTLLPMQRYVRHVMEHGLASVRDVLRVFSSSERAEPNAKAPVKARAKRKAASK